jgi:hypothetical protein
MFTIPAGEVDRTDAATSSTVPASGLDRDGSMSFTTPSMEVQIEQDSASHCTDTAPLAGLNKPASPTLSPILPSTTALPAPCTPVDLIPQNQDVNLAVSADSHTHEYDKVVVSEPSATMASSRAHTSLPSRIAKVRPISISNTTLSNSIPNIYQVTNPLE